MQRIEVIDEVRNLPMVASEAGAGGGLPAATSNDQPRAVASGVPVDEAGVVVREL